MKKIFTSALLGLCFQLGAHAQTDKAAAYAATITSGDLKKHLTIIAGDEMEGRETGTEGQRKAAVYIAEQFKSMGLQSPVAVTAYQQMYPLHQDSLISSRLQINGITGEPGKDYYSQLSLTESGNFKGKLVVFVGYGIEDSAYSDYTGLNVKGKVVLFFTGEPKTGGKFLVSGTARSSEWSYPGLSKKLATAKNKGAIGAFIISPMQATFTPRIVESNRKSTMYYPRTAAKGKPINHAFLSHAFAKNLFKVDFDSLLSTVKAGAPIEKTRLFETKQKIVFSYSKHTTVIPASNVMGVIEGTDKKDEFVFLTAHYDHLGKRDGKIYYGADDDGSGTCAVIEMAEAFAKAKAAGAGPRRTIVFMTVSGEEKGLWGSEYYSDHPIFPLDKTSVDLNTDMVGRIDTERTTGDTLNYIYVIGHNKLSTDLQVISEAVNNQYTNLVLDYKFDDVNDPNRIYFRSDHYNFARKGVPILFFYDGMLKADYHKPTDTVDKIYWELYEKRTRMIFHTAWEIANRGEMLKRDIPLTGETR